MALGNQSDPTLQKVLRYVGKYEVDWDIVFARINSWWDREIAACRLTDRTTRTAAFDELDHELEERTRQAKSVMQPVTTLFDTRRVVSEQMADLLLERSRTSMRGACDIEEREKLELDLTKWRLHWLLLRGARARTPKNLSSSFPKYIRTVPDDVFAGAPLHYESMTAGISS